MSGKLAFMTTDTEQVLQAQVAALELAVADVLGAAGRLDAAGKYVTGKFFAAQIIEGLRLAVAANDSPFVTRMQAAARWGCSVDAIDRAARAGVLVPARGGVNPLFEKAQGDEAVRSGAWSTPVGNHTGDSRSSAKTRTSICLSR